MAATQLTGRQVGDGTIQRDDLDVATSGKAVVRKIVQGTGVTISSTGADSGTGDVTINATAGGSGTVTSVGLSAPSGLLSVSGSPVTASGTLALALATQNANKVLAGPASGADAAPTFRNLTQADLNSEEVVQNYTLSGDTNNLSLNADTKVLRVTQPDWNGGTPYYITGLTGGVAGRVLWVYNVPASGGYVGLKQDSANSTSANRIYCWRGTDKGIGTGAWAQLWYDGAASRWVQRTTATAA